MQLHVVNTAKKAIAFPEPVYRTLGRTGLKISVISFGTSMTPEADVIRMAFDHGVNFVDTARKYLGGKNEEIVGKALKGWRDKVYVATKPLPSSTTKMEIIRDVESSLKALDTDYIDVIQLHEVIGKERLFIPEVREAFLKLKEQGKVRFFGVGTHTNQVEVLNAMVDDREQFFDMALVAYNFMSSKDVGDAIARAAKANIGVIAMKTQAGGYETGENKIKPHQAALKWALNNPNITAAIPGMQNLAQLMENIAVMGMPLQQADERMLQRYSEAVKQHYCHLCGICEGSCPRGVEISTINRSLMYAEGGYKSRELSISTYGGIPSSVSASACAECAVCTACCVNGLNISAKMKHARELFA